MAEIFISYRWADTQQTARHLREKLERDFGPGSVFLDTSSGRLGETIEHVSVKGVEYCAVLLVLIGKTWLAPTANGPPRLFAPNDIVRAEIRTGLVKGQIIVVPVTIDHADLPQAEDLPLDIGELAHLVSRPLRNESFDGDYTDLSRRIRSLLQGLGRAPFDDEFDLADPGRPFEIVSPCSLAEALDATRIAGHYFPLETIPPDFVIKVVTQSPWSLIVLKNRRSGEVIGYADAYAVQSDVFQGIKEGRLGESELIPDNFLPLDRAIGQREFGLYIGGMAIQLNGSIARSSGSRALAYGLAELLLATAFAEREHLEAIAVAQSGAGANLLIKRGFRRLVSKDIRQTGNGDVYHNLLHRRDLIEMRERWGQQEAALVRLAYSGQFTASQTGRASG